MSKVQFDQGFEYYLGNSKIWLLKQQLKVRKLILKSKGPKIVLVFSSYLTFNFEQIAQKKMIEEDRGLSLV